MQDNTCIIEAESLPYTAGPVGIPLLACRNGYLRASPPLVLMQGPG